MDLRYEYEIPRPSSYSRCARRSGSARHDRVEAACGAFRVQASGWNNQGFADRKIGKRLSGYDLHGAIPSTGPRIPRPPLRS